METVHNVINLCPLYDVGGEGTCTPNAVHKVPIDDVLQDCLRFVWLC